MKKKLPRYVTQIKTTIGGCYVLLNRSHVNPVEFMTLMVATAKPHRKPRINCRVRERRRGTLVTIAEWKRGVLA